MKPNIFFLGCFLRMYIPFSSVTKGIYIKWGMQKGAMNLGGVLGMNLFGQTVI